MECRFFFSFKTAPFAADYELWSRRTTVKAAARPPHSIKVRSAAKMSIDGDSIVAET